METRYSLLLKPGARLDSDDEEDENGRPSQEYAAFLLEKDRKCTRDFFVDSKRLQKTYDKQKDSSDKQEEKQKQQSKPLTVVDLMAKKKQDQRDHDRRLKIIEDHMWQHKQEERELKRNEGDIIKNQREIRRTMRDYENAITRKRMAEEKKINQGQQKYTDLKQSYLHRKEDQTKQRIEAKLSYDQSHKEIGRKSNTTSVNISRQYRTKADELELRRIEINRITQDFETKLRHKEEEQFKLKQELADLAISMNMEAQKGSTQMSDFQKKKKKEDSRRLEDDQTNKEEVDTKLARSDNDAKSGEQGRRKLSAELTLTRAHLQLKQREEERHRKDTDNQLKDNHTTQRQLNHAQQHADMDRQNNLINQKIQEHNQRKHVLASQLLRNKKENGVQHEAQFSERAKKRAVEVQRRQHEDHLKHFQKEVTKGEDVEHSLYNKVKNSEYKRQKQEQSLRRMYQQLNETQRDNAQAIKTQMIEASQTEEELKQNIQREQATLAKAHAEREDSYNMLQKHRQQLRQDKYLLTEHEREHHRLVRVGNKTEQLSYA